MLVIEYILMPYARLTLAEEANFDCEDMLCHRAIRRKLHLNTNISKSQGKNCALLFV